MRRECRLLEQNGLNVSNAPQVNNVTRRRAGDDPERRGQDHHVLLIQGWNRALHGCGQYRLDAGQPRESGAGDRLGPGSAWVTAILSPFSPTSCWSGPLASSTSFSILRTRRWTQKKESPIPDWHLRYANIRAHAVPVDWEFPENGVLHLVPAGRQDSGYPLRVNAFDWRLFYERLGGGVWLEAVKRQMRESYDYILVDSRTGVSDTSGICTVQVPDDLVVCFTLNNQSMRGASAVGHSALQQRRREDGTATLQVWPLPMRVESAEQERLQVARALARTRFSGLMGHLPCRRR